MYNIEFIYLQGFEYLRSGNLIRNCLEECIVVLEGGKYGK